MERRLGKGRMRQRLFPERLGRIRLRPRPQHRRFPGLPIRRRPGLHCTGLRPYGLREGGVLPRDSTRRGGNSWESHKRRRRSEKEGVIVDAEIVETAPPVKLAPAKFNSSCRGCFSNQPCADCGGSGRGDLDPTAPEIGASPLMGDHPQYGICVVKEELQSDEDTSNPCARDLKPRQRRNGWRKHTQKKRKKPEGSTDELGRRANKQSSCEHPTSLGSSSVDDVRIKSRLGSVISRRRSITEEEKARTLELAMSFRSKRPFGISVMRDSNVYHGYYMGLPSSLVKHLPRASRTIRLRGPFEEVWAVVYIHYEGRGGFSTGWGKFASTHNLESDDVLVFELSRPLEVRVHIYRVVEQVSHAYH